MLVSEGQLRFVVECGWGESSEAFNGSTEIIYSNLNANPGIFQAGMTSVKGCSDVTCSH